MSRHLESRFVLFFGAALVALFASGCSCGDQGLDWCVPIDCAEVGKNCGTIDDGCGGTINCGYCGPGYQCGLHEPNVCGNTGSGGGGNGETDDRTDPLGQCVEEDCLDAGRECGTHNDGCGGEDICGFCGGGAICGGGGEPGICGMSACTPTTCVAAGAECGRIPDGCGGFIDCGGCEAGLFCGGGGANRCGTTECTTEPTCEDTCGYISDGCGDVVHCPCENFELCADGVCLEGAEDEVGSPCTDDAQCDTGYCLTEAETSWHDGYCTVPCGSDADCGEGNICGFLDGGSSGVCLQTCAGDGECRTGYTCATLDGSPTRACIPGGTGTGPVGSTCDTSADCAGGSDGICLGPDEGFPDGYCTLGCGDGTEDVCPDGTICVFSDAGQGICVETCESDADCAGGYGCRGFGDDFGICWPGGSVGDACFDHDDCETGMCLGLEPHGWTGGYCTSPCESDADCAQGDYCMPWGPNGSGVCVAGCESDADCRTGYACAETDSGGMACLPTGSGGGTGSGDGDIGDSCIDDSDCAGGDAAVCVPTASGGECSIICGGDEDCPDGATCVTDGSVSPGFCQIVDPDDPSGECNQDQDCPAGQGCFEGPSGSFCATACDFNADCPPGTRCTTNYEGSGGFCQEIDNDVPGSGDIGDPCSSSADCAGGTEAVCVPTPNGGVCSIRCSTDEDCPSGDVCITDGAVSPGFCQSGDPTIDACSEDEDCGGGRICIDTPNGRQCADPCDGHVECPPGTLCTSDEVFGGGGYCVPVDEDLPGSGDTGDPCTYDDHCDSDFCITEDTVGWPGGYCTWPCETHADCGPGEACVPGGPAGQYICMAECNTSRECRDGYVCRDLGGGSTVCSPESGDGQPGEDCETTTDCDDGLVCVENMQGDRECAEPCEPGDECDDGEVCRDTGDNLDTGSCQPGNENECTNDDDCPPGEICGFSLATGNLTCMDEDTGGIDWGIPPEMTFGDTPTGDPCTHADECERPDCITEYDEGWKDGYCTGTCSSDDDCPGDAICGLQRVLEIEMTASGGFNLEDVTDVFGYDPGMGVTVNTGKASKVLVRMLMRYLLGDMFADFEGQVVIGRCLAPCSSDAQCRDGYSCIQVHQDGRRACIAYANGPGQVGDPCRYVSDCSGGLPGYCKMEGANYPDGYCTQRCDDGQCPVGSRCTRVEKDPDRYACMYSAACDLNELGAECGWNGWSAECWPNPTCRYWHSGWWEGDDWYSGWWYWDYDRCSDARIYCDPVNPCPIDHWRWDDLECTAHYKHQSGFCSHWVTDEPCRTDYSCYTVDGGPGVCSPSAKGSRGVGDPCDTIRDCAGGVEGTCILEREDDDQVYWPSGYCSWECPNCPSGSGCAEMMTGDKYCLDRCSRNSDCRSGYTCEVYRKYRRVKCSWSSGCRCKTKTYKACVFDPEEIDVDLDSSWACSDPK